MRALLGKTGIMTAIVVSGIALIVAAAGIAAATPRGPIAHQAKRGKRGPRGLRGPPGAAGIASIQYVSSAPVPLCGFSAGDCSVASATATCPAGSAVVGGAANADTIETSISTFASSTGYIAVADNASEFSGTLTATAVCASGPGLQALARDHARPSSAVAATLARLRSER